MRNFNRYFGKTDLEHLIKKIQKQFNYLKVNMIRHPQKNTIIWK